MLFQLIPRIRQFTRHCSALRDSNQYSLSHHLKNALESEPGLNEEAAQKLENFFRALADAPASLLLLDYDGTLAPFRVDRFQARPWAGVRELLKRIQEQGRTRMIVITGRPAAEIAPMLNLDTPLEVWGLHGA
jgi:phosphoglycolate phosphatase-like HAD superfamily hydrolase